MHTPTHRHRTHTIKTNLFQNAISPKNKIIRYFEIHTKGQDLTVIKTRKDQFSMLIRKQRNESLVLESKVVAEAQKKHIPTVEDTE